MIEPDIQPDAEAAWGSTDSDPSGDAGGRPVRPPPDFIIVGERRSGSTYLSNCLRRHPEIWMYPAPDFDYFYDQKLGSMSPVTCDDSDEEWSRRHDLPEYRAFLQGGAPKQRVGHKGANLLFWQQAHARMRRFAPDARLLVVLRDPVQRAWSQYWNEYGKGREMLPFAEALESESERSRSSWHRMNLGYVERGMYAQSLHRLLQYYPAAAIHVCVLEQIVASPAAEFARIFEFLQVGTPESALQESAESNTNWTLLRRPWVDRPSLRGAEAVYARFANRLSRALVVDRYRRRALSKALQMPFRFPAKDLVMPDALRAALRARYAEPNRDLELMIGRPIPEWRR